MMILQSIFICCLSYKLYLCIWKLQSISEPLIIVNEEKKSIIWQRWIYLAANVNDVIQKSSVSSDLIYVTRWLLHGLKHTVTAKPDSISHQTHCKCIRYIIFSPSTSDLLSLSFFSFSSPSLSLFFFFYNCTFWRIYAFLGANKSVWSSSCPEWCPRATMSKQPRGSKNKRSGQLITHVLNLCPSLTIFKCFLKITYGCTVLGCNI